MSQRNRGQDISTVTIFLNFTVKRNQLCEGLSLNKTLVISVGSLNTHHERALCLNSNTHEGQNSDSE